MCYEFEQYWVQRAREEAKRREEERVKREEKPKEPVPQGGVKDPEPVPV
jgi:hypothetical protein